MVKIKKEGNYIVVLDELDNEIFNAPANKTFFKVDNNRISLSSDFNNRSDVEKVSFNIDEVLDSLGVSMVNPLLWLRDNTGFSTASGGSGADGIDGVDGESAYQLAVNNGFVGTEVEWLESLKGEDGLKPIGYLKLGLTGEEVINQSVLDNDDIKFNHKGNYEVDLNFWGIDESTTPLQTTQRLNNLFKWAAKCPALTDIDFPESYEFTLDVEQDTIITRYSSAYDSNVNSFPHHFAIIIQNLRNVNINFRDCKFNLVPNGWTRYQLIYGLELENVAITGGWFVGDRDGHDYETIVIQGADHEHGLGVLIEGRSRNVTLKNMKIQRVMGYGVGFYPSEPYRNSYFKLSFDLSHISEGKYNTYGVADQDEAQQPFVDSEYTKTVIRDLPVGYYDLDFLTLVGLGFFSASGITDRCPITVYWFDENDNFIISYTGDEGTLIPKPKEARKVALDFKQPLIATKWNEGFINETTGVDEPLTTEQQATQSTSNFGRTELTDFTENELLDRHFRPIRLKSDDFFDYGKYTGITVYYYDDAENFISSAPFTNDVMSVPINASKWRMFGSGTPYNTRNTRFQIFLSPLRNAENVVIDNCVFMENRAMGGAGICNRLTVKNCTFVRNGTTIQGNDKGITLGYAWDLEEGHKINKDCIFDNNRCIQNFEGSLLFYPLDNLTITNNYFDDRKLVIHEKSNNVILDNNTFVNADKGNIPKEFENKNAKFINCRIDSLWGMVENAEFIDCYIEGGTAANGFDSESLEVIEIKNSTFRLTENFSRNNFIKTYSKTSVRLINCTIINEGGGVTLIDSSSSGATFPQDTAIGLVLDGCTVKDLTLSPESRIHKILNSTLDIKLAFNASIKDSNIERYRGIDIKNSLIEVQPILGAFCKLTFDLRTNSRNNEYEFNGAPQNTFYAFEFNEDLETRGDLFRINHEGVNSRVFRAQKNAILSGTEIRSESSTGLIELNGSFEENYVTYVPQRQ